MTDAVNAAQAAGKNIGEGARELGRVSLATGSPARAETDEALAGRARRLLVEEIERLAAARGQFALEQRGGAPARSSTRLDAMVASIEGATRFALRLGVVSPGEARQIWADARAAGIDVQRQDEVSAHTDDEEQA